MIDKKRNLLETALHCINRGIHIKEKKDPKCQNKRWSNAIGVAFGIEDMFEVFMCYRRWSELG